MLTDQKIKDEVSLSSAYSNGCFYFKNGLVKKLTYDALNDTFDAQVKGSRNYQVSVVMYEDGEIEQYSCSCPAYYEYEGACKHVVAVLKEIKSRWAEFYPSGNPKDVTLTESTRALFTFFNNISDQDVKQSPGGDSLKTKVIPLFCFSIENGQKQNWLEFSIGNERLYIMRNIKTFIESMLSNNKIAYGKNFTYDPEKVVFDDLSEEFCQLMKNAYLDERNLSAGNSYNGYHYQYNQPNYNSAFSESRKFKLTNMNLLKFMEIMKDKTFDVSINGTRIPGVKIIEGRPNFKLNVTVYNKGLKANLDTENDVYFGLDLNFNYFYHKQAIYKVDSLFASYAAPLMKCFNDNRKPEILIPHTEIQSFFANVVPEIEKVAKIKLDSSLTKSFYREELERQVYFDKYGEGIAAKAVFKYGEILLNPAVDPLNYDLKKDGKNLLREIADENRLLNIFKKYGFEIAGKMYVQKDEEKSYVFLKEGLAEIREVAEVFYTDAFKNISIKNSGQVSAGVRVNMETGLLEMRMQYEDVDPKELMALLASYKLKKRYHRLKSGQFISLDSAEFQTAAELIDQLDLTPADITKKVIELPKYRALYIDSLAREKESLRIERSSNFKKMVQDVSEPQDMEFELPVGIQGRLRDYQKTGYRWLKTLAYYGFGGILADDMGLGKTLQIITLVKSEAQGVKKPSLVVAPTSLIYNWQEEVRKFAPDLAVTVLSGTQSGRRERFAEIENSDLVVTSYGMIKRDIELYADYKFKYCFVDEAQHIKNPNTQNAKAVKQIRAGGYFALTGTPVENTLTELWSIFDFVMPGYLHSHNKFVGRFETPIVKNGDKTALKELGRHIKPFILRRLKKEVLKELPEKIESKMTNEMTPEQKKVYLAYLIKAKKEFEEELAENGFENSRIKILAILTRLRQICCHPGLFIEDYQGGSGKLEMLLELLEDALEGGHRLLVFSQFTSMLALIKNELAKRKMNYHYLDGSISAEERLNLVNLFNSGENDIFLISLKAGGTGLNLTGADMVIHFDPWWNPAVEDQATDRAYRIGQKNMVQVFKLITKDTIEEKIFELQQKKKELIDAVIKPGENFLAKMTEEEIRELFSIV